ncbi:MAG: WD40 repeat domain-containing protein, partial [Ktedonobacteraceae bacterium]
MVGVVTVLVASGKFTSLFAQSSATPTHTPGGRVTPRTTSTLTARPTQAQATSTSKIPLGTTLTTYMRQSSDVTGVCWSPAVSNRMVASCSQDGNASIWNATTGEVVRTFPRSGPLSTLIWSPNGQYIAFAGDASTVEVWDAASGNLISTCTGHTQPIRGLAWSPDSQHIVSASQDHSAIVWDITTGSQLITFSGHSDYVWVAAWAP